MKSGPKKIHQMFESRLSILIYAAHRPDPFRVSDVILDVVHSSSQAVRKMLCELIDLGYIEKTTIYDYRATNFTKQLFGVA